MPTHVYIQQITLLVGEKLCHVNIMFKYLGLAYKDSDYTTVIAIEH